MRTIYFFQGLPGSGKSTAALEIINRNPRVKRVNKDSLRLMLHGSKPDYVAERKTTKPLQDYAITLLLGRGYDVICDDTNLKRSYYNDICKLAEKIGDVKVEVRYFDLPLKECLKRNAAREKPVPEDLIKRMHKKNIATGLVPFEDDYFPIKEKKFERNNKLPDALIVDIDGTAALNQGRRCYYDLTLVLNDDPNVPVIDLVRLEAKSDTKILFVSGRDDEALTDTKMWLDAHNVPCDALFMRVTGDNRKDYIIKKEIYEREIKDKYNIKYALDDRPQVIRMWRSLGITVFQLNDIDF